MTKTDTHHTVLLRKNGLRGIAVRRNCAAAVGIIERQRDAWSTAQPDVRCGNMYDIVRLEADKRERRLAMLDLNAVELLKDL